MDIIKPVFIIGTGRCGSSLLFNVLSKHPNVAFLSNICDKYPKAPSLNRLAMQLYDLGVINKVIEKKIVPSEAYSFWDCYAPEFSNPHRDLVGSDVRVNVKNSLRKTIAAMLTRKRSRLLVKITGWPRISYLKEIFPDALFIHMLRDGRAVANSFLNLNISWWTGWMGPENWKWGELPTEYQKEWKKYNQSYIALAAILWKILMDAFELAKNFLSQNQLLEIRYEDLVQNPVAVLKKTIKFSELNWDKKFEKRIRQIEIRNANHKWKEQLTSSQQRILQECLEGHLNKYGYG
ncbi:MAG TPA: sulfotransferase [bacterium (Candidatus Stahlbacteria)]|nr:sulfotransferase [Candidatus Stahlbacteria bacterium]